MISWVATSHKKSASKKKRSTQPKRSTKSKTPKRSKKSKTPVKTHLNPQQFITYGRAVINQYEQNPYQARRHLTKLLNYYERVLSKKNSKSLVIRALVREMKKYVPHTPAMITNTKKKSAAKKRSNRR